MKETGNTFEKIQVEIFSTIKKEQAADMETEKKEQAARSAYDVAKADMMAALDSGDLEQYKAAGLRVEEKRLELEFIEKSKERGRKQGATAADDARITAAIRAESSRIYFDSIAQIKSILGEMDAVSTDALRKFSVLDEVYASWESAVMRKPEQKKICRDDYRLVLSQLKGIASAQLSKFGYFEKS